MANGVTVRVCWFWEFSPTHCNYLDMSAHGDREEGYVKSNDPRAAAAKFASDLAPQELISITESVLRGVLAVSVWYRIDRPKAFAFDHASNPE